jgi:hypothetical protein
MEAKLITMLKRAINWSLSWARSIDNMIVPLTTEE